MDAIVYSSNTGFTAKYAEMLAKATSVPIYEIKPALKQLAQGTKIVYLGWVFGDRVMGLPQAMKKFEISAVCAVGMTKPCEEVEARERAANSVGEQIGFFTLWGGCDLRKLRGIKKLLLNMVIKNTVKDLEAKPQQELSETDRDMLDIMKNGRDCTSEEQLERVLEHIKKS